MLKTKLFFLFFLFSISFLNAQSPKVYKGMEGALKAPAEVVHLKLSSKDSLTDALLKFPNLKDLDLSYMGVEKLPEFLSKLEKLEVLNLSGNAFKKFPAVILKLKQLKKLYLFECDLHRIPEEFSQLRTLTHLDLSRNKWKDDFPLNTYHDKTVLPSSLKVLKLRYCKLDHLQPLILELRNLDSLDLSFNDLEELPVTMDQLSYLSYLNLAFNQIEFISSTLEHLDSLKFLDLRYNQLAYRPMNLMEKEGLKLNVHGNPFLKERAEKQVLRRNSLKEVKDGRDGKIYPAMQFGTDYWMTKDLNWKIDSSIEIVREKVNVYRSKEQSEQQLCPAGWHQANLDDWKALGKLALAEFPIDLEESSNLASIEYGRWMYSTREDPTVVFDPSYVADFYGAKYFMLTSWGKTKGFQNLFELNLFAKGVYSKEREAFLDRQATPYFIPEKGGELYLVRLFRPRKIIAIKELGKGKREDVPDTYSTVRCVSDKSYDELEYSSKVNVKEYLFPKIEKELKREFFDSSLNLMVALNIKQEGNTYWIEQSLGNEVPLSVAYTLEMGKYYLSAAVFYQHKTGTDRLALDNFDTIYTKMPGLPLLVKKGQMYKQMMQLRKGSDSILYSTNFYLDERGYLVEDRLSFVLGHSSQYHRERFYYKKGIGLVDIEYPKRERDIEIDNIKGK